MLNDVIELHIWYLGIQYQNHLYQFLAQESEENKCIKKIETRYKTKNKQKQTQKTTNFQKHTNVPISVTIFEG